MKTLPSKRIKSLYTVFISYVLPPLVLCTDVTCALVIFKIFVTSLLKLIEGFDYNGWEIFYLSAMSFSIWSAEILHKRRFGKHLESNLTDKEYRKLTARIDKILNEDISRRVRSIDWVCEPNSCLNHKRPIDLIKSRRAHLVLDHLLKERHGETFN